LKIPKKVFGYQTFYSWINFLVVEVINCVDFAGTIINVALQFAETFIRK